MSSGVANDEIDADHGKEGFRTRHSEVVTRAEGNSVVTSFNLCRTKGLDAPIGIGDS